MFMWVQLANRDILFILLYMFMCSIFTKLLQITTLETFKVFMFMFMFVNVFTNVHVEYAYMHTTYHSRGIK